ncbi:uncharacterized protein [Bactrocera oleae]|uniref:uncharacterized protein isoform X2 n=1 Tax=Bactrocera oleae TaxID=104688 RepID=UPI00387E2429
MPYLKNTWEDKKSVIRNLEYFYFFTNEQVSMKQKGKRFELVDFVKSDDTFRNLSLAEIRSHMRVKSRFSSVVEVKSQSDEDISAQQQKKKNMDITAIERQCALGNPVENSALSLKLGSMSSIISYSALKTEGHEYNEDSRSEENEEYHFLLEEESSCSYDYFSKAESSNNTFENSSGKHAAVKKLTETKIENHFIDVGTISKGGIFGLGEAMEHRIVIAENKEKTLLRTHHYLRSVDDRKKLVNLLASLMCFSRIPPKVRARLTPVIKLSFVGPGRKIIKEGDPPSTVYFILSGEVELYKRVYDREKTLLRTHHYLRSVDDRKKLVNLLASLMCFSRIPPKVRARLTPVIKLSFVGPGRKIIKEGDPPSTVYFILSGEVELYKRVYDRTKHIYVDKLESISGPGDCLGDIEMIEECDRLNTYISRNQVELLVLHEDDFNNILRPTMSKQWMERKAALFSLEYFKYLNNDQIITACKLGLIRQFDPLETIYYEDKGHISYVHFVISGECMILQCLKMKVTTKLGGKLFELFDISQNEDENIFQDSALNISKDGNFRNILSFFDVNYEIMSEEDDKNKKGSRLFQKMDIKSIEVSCGLKGTSEEEITSGKDSHFSKEYLNESEDTEFLSEFSNFSYTQKLSVETLHEHVISSESKTGIDKQRLSNINNKENIPPGIKIRSSGNRNYFNNLNSNIEPEGMSSTKKESNTKIENHFIDVGSITFGGIFSLGEKLEHRVIMARTTVQCLMLPRYWLMERDQNPGNIWQRRRFYLDSTIPSREQLFKDFLTTRTWQKFKNSIISSNLTRYLGNPTKVQDIPIICRIVEPSED